MYYPYEPKNEDFSKRSRDTKTFQNPDGSYTAVFLSGIHYQDEQGNWRDIDLSITENNSGEYSDFSFCNTTNNFKTFYNSDPNKGFVISKEKMDLSIGNNPSIKITSSDGLQSRQIRKNTVSGQKQDARSLKYVDLFPAIDFEIVTMPFGVESGYIIKDATWLQSESDKLVTFSQEVDLPQGWYVVSDKKTMTSDFATNSFTIMMPDGSDGIRFKQVVVFDGSISYDEIMKSIEIPEVGTQHDKDGKKIADRFEGKRYFSEYQVSFQNGKLIVSYAIPSDWLLDPSRSFPVYVDPTVEVLTSYTQSTSTSSNVPYNTFYHDNIMQVLLLSSNLSAAGITSGSTISAIDMYASANSGMNISNFRIRTQNTTNTSLTSWVTSGWSMNLGPVTLSSSSWGTGWHTHSFSSNLSYTGNGILIEFSRDNSTYSSGGGNYVRSVSNQCVGDYSDSGCGNYSSWTCTDDDLSYVPSMRLTYSPASGPCSSITTMNCGTTYTATLTPSGGYWTNYTGASLSWPGSEKVWAFTAPTTGSYTFNLNEGSADADFFLMSACDPNSTNLSNGYWYGGSSGSSNTVTLTGGVTYYLIADLYSSSSSTTVTVSVTCPSSATEMIVPASGNNSYTTCSGHLYDNGGASGNYASSSNGYTVLYPGVAGQVVRVSGTITCEGGYDYLTIYNGVGTGGTILWGGSSHGSGTSCSTFTVPAITSTTGPLTVKFYSDGSNNCAGFDLTVSCVVSAGTGADCASSIAFCTEDNYLFPASTNVTGYGQVGCLYSTPNPAWYYMQVGNPGDIIISISSGYDVDFIAWGPYTSVDTYCSEITMGPCTPTSCPNNTSNPSFYPYGDIVDCSYSAASSETVHILGAQTGQVYALLITNYSNQVTNISFQQSSGSGTADCSIVAPPISSNSVVCVGNTLELYVTYSQPGATYQWTGPNGWTSNQMNPTRPNATTAMSGTYSMVVTIGGLTSDPVTTQVTVAPNVTPTFNAVGPYCQGASIPALPTTSTNGITGTWSPAINNNATTTYTFTPNAGQCASTTTMQIVVNPLPSPSINPNPATICAGGSIQLTASGGATYNWSNSSTSPSINVSPASTTTYTVTVTSAAGCSASTSRQVTVNPLPTVAATVDCGLGVGQGVINVTSPTGANYQYSLNGGSFQSSPSFGNLANGSYTVVATNTTTTCSSPESIVVVDCGCANPPTVTLATTSGEICGISSPFTLGGNTFGGSATAVTLSHNGGGNLNITSATSSPFSFTYTPAASDLGNTVTIIVTTNNPIGLPCTVEQKTLSLNVLTLPTVVVGYNPPVCETGTLILSETGGAAINWSWNGPNGFISTSQNPQINNATAAANGTYSVTVTDGNTCTNTGSVLVSISPNPVASATFAPIACNGGTTVVTVSASGGTQPYSYGLNISGSLYPGQIHTTLGAGVYVAYVRDANSCIDTTLVMITSPAPLEVSYVFENPSCKGARNGSIEIAVAGGVEPYLFETNNVIIDIPLFVGLSAGRYDVIITDANNCSFELDGIVLSESNKDCIRIPDAFTPNGDGINDTWIIENIKMFPSATIFVYNRWGQEVWVGNPGEEWDGKRNSKLMPAGTYLYLVELYDGSKPYTGTVTLVY